MEQIITRTRGEYTFTLSRLGQNIIVDVSGSNDKYFTYAFPERTDDGKDAQIENEFGLGLLALLNPQTSEQHQAITELLAEVTAALSNMLLSPREKI